MKSLVNYDIKKGWFKNVDNDGVEFLMIDTFGNCKKEGALYVASYGVLSRIEAEVVSKEILRVETTTTTGTMKDEDILDTKRKLNIFVEKATGFDAKARMKRAQQKAKKGTL